MWSAELGKKPVGCVWGLKSQESKIITTDINHMPCLVSGDPICEDSEVPIVSGVVIFHL